MARIKVVDMIMQAGKTSACIDHMNAHPDERYLYITPYLEEAERIKAGCPALHFVEPASWYSRVEGGRRQKSEHLVDLLGAGKNIASTHALFKRYTPEMIEQIEKNGYNLIVDEALSVFAKSCCTRDDANILCEIGWARREGSVYVRTEDANDGYRGGLRDVLGLLQDGELIDQGDEEDVEEKNGGERLFYWQASYPALTKFKSVTLMTYMFHFSDMRCFLDLHNVQYEYIGIAHDGALENRRYWFCPIEEAMVPEYTTHLRDFIEVDSKRRRSDVASNRYALSANFYRSASKERLKEISNACRTFFDEHSEYGVDARLVGSYKSAFPLKANGRRNPRTVAGNGFRKPELWTPFNCCATNTYADRYVAAFIANIFPDPSKARYLRERGVLYDEDGEALSTLVQWVWRTAVRRNGDGKPPVKIHLFIPSRRMRNLFTAWMEHPFSAKELVARRSAQQEGGESA